MLFRGHLTRETLSNPKGPAVLKKTAAVLALTLCASATTFGQDIQVPTSHRPWGKAYSGYGAAQFTQPTGRKIVGKTYGHIGTAGTAFSYRPNYPYLDVPEQGIPFEDLLLAPLVIGDPYIRPTRHFAGDVVEKYYEVSPVDDAARYLNVFDPSSLTQFIRGR